MSVQQLITDHDLNRYDQWIKKTGNGNLWQSLERKHYLEALDKEVRIYTSEDDGHIRGCALVSIDRTIGGYSTWEIPRGPLWNVEKSQRHHLIETIIHDAKKDQCLALYISPATEIRPFDLSTFRPSTRHIHCEATRIIDLTQSEDAILSQMKQKGRYNIKVAQKNGIIVKESTDIDAFYDLVTKTGKRDRFVHLPKKTYEAFLNDLPGSFLLLAYVNQTLAPEHSSGQGAAEPIAGVLSVVWEKRGIYYYGASNHAERAKMAPYLLQWESMRYAKERGCTAYDLLGIAPQKSAKCEVRSAKSHPWEGVSHFKEKFGGEIVTYPKEKMIVLKPVMYWLLSMKRKVFG